MKRECVRDRNSCFQFMSFTVCVRYKNVAMCECVFKHLIVRMRLSVYMCALARVYVLFVLIIWFSSDGIMPNGSSV